MNAVETMLAVVLMGLVIGAVVYVVNKAKAKKNSTGGGSKGNGDAQRR